MTLVPGGAARATWRCSLVSADVTGGLIVRAEQAAAFNQSIDQRTPMGRKGRPEELDGLIVYLAGGASSYVTGQVFSNDGRMDGCLASRCRQVDFCGLLLQNSSMINDRSQALPGSLLKRALQ
jgi:hypothetical protein